MSCNNPPPTLPSCAMLPKWQYTPDGGRFPALEHCYRVRDEAGKPLLGRCERCYDVYGKGADMLYPEPEKRPKKPKKAAKIKTKKKKSTRERKTSVRFRTPEVSKRVERLRRATWPQPDEDPDAGEGASWERSLANTPHKGIYDDGRALGREVTEMWEAGDEDMASIHMRMFPTPGTKNW